MRIPGRSQSCYRLGPLQDRLQGLRQDVNFSFFCSFGSNSVYLPDALIKAATSPGNFPRDVVECLSSLLQNTFSFSSTGRSVRIVSALDGAGDFVTLSAWRRELGCWACCRLGVCTLLVEGELNMAGLSESKNVMEVNPLDRKSVV